jgi:peptidyl-prolyl cis-trans isomerase SurA
MTMQRALHALALGLVLTIGTVVPGLAASVRVTVNETPITDVQIQQRARLMQLEHHPGNLTKAATDELVNEALELGEAKRLGITVSDSQVDGAYLNVARNLKVSQDKLTQILTASGVGADTLRDRMRATLAFNQISQNIITPRVQFSEADLAKQAASKVTASNSYDYILKEVLFVGANGKSGAGRVGDANRYRAQFKGCASAVQLSENFKDAAVTDIGRRHATQVPEAIAAELGKLPVGGITKPRVVAEGVSMLAICQKEEAKDLTFITNQLRSSEGNDKLKVETDKYLADLKAKAKIVTH